MKKLIILAVVAVFALSTTAILAQEPDYTNFAPGNKSLGFTTSLTIGVVAKFAQQSPTDDIDGVAATIGWCDAGDNCFDHYLATCWNGNYQPGTLANKYVEDPSAAGCYESKDSAQFWLESNTTYALQIGVPLLDNGMGSTLPGRYTIGLFCGDPATWAPPQLGFVPPGPGFRALSGWLGPMTIFNGCVAVGDPTSLGTYVPETLSAFGNLPMPAAPGNPGCRTGNISQLMGGGHNLALATAANGPPVLGTMNIHLRVQRSGIADAAGTYTSNTSIVATAP